MVTVVGLAIIGILAVDGVGMYVAHRTAVEVAKGAAEQAAKVFVASRGDTGAAEDVAEGIAEEAGAEIVSATFHKGTSRWTEVTVRARPKSYFLRHIPRLEDSLMQESTAVVHF